MPFLNYYKNIFPFIYRSQMNTFIFKLLFMWTIRNTESGQKSYFLKYFQFEEKDIWCVNEIEAFLT